MTVLLVILVSAVFLFGAGRLYSGYISRKLGMDPSRPTPAITLADGRDYVATPTPVVFAHHFASIAGAGPIIGPVIAIIYGWGPALLWVLLGGVFIGAVHDYLATYMATREGGTSIVTIVRRMIGKGPFLAITVMVVVTLALVCAAFLNLSASALTSKLPFERLDLPRDQEIFRVVTTPAGQEEVVIGGIASMSVVCITIVAPLIGWLYLKKRVAVWKCSLLAIAICAASITVGVFHPIAFEPLTWQLLLSAYVLIAAGVPVWIFLQSRDFINVHILYVGMAALVLTLVVVGFRDIGQAAYSLLLTVLGLISLLALVVGIIHTAWWPRIWTFLKVMVVVLCLAVAVKILLTVTPGGTLPASDPMPSINLAEGNQANGFIWPGMFILIACGAVSGFHSLCAGGTTCKQINNEKATRQIGYNAMLLESFLAACVIAVFIVGAIKADYISDVHPVALGGLTGATSNPVLGFAMAVGNAVKLAFGVPIAVGALAGMVLLEGFLVTTLDTAVRLTRYLIEEVWRTIFARYDVFAQPVAAKEQIGEGVAMPMGADGLPVAPSVADQPAAPREPIATTGLLRGLCKLLRQYWFNSGLAVGLMLAFALTGGQKVLWAIFATSNQLLAALVLATAALWLLRRKRSFWFALAPAIAMLVTTVTSLCLEIAKLIPKLTTQPGKSVPLLIAEGLTLVITVYLVIAGVAEAIRFVRDRRHGATAA